MSTASTTWVLNISENIIPKFKSMQTEGKGAGDVINKSFDKASDSIDKTKKKVDSLGDSFKKLKPMDWNAMATGFRSLNDQMSKLKGPGAAFDEAKHDLKGLTDATEEQMGKMTKSAREMSKEFGGNGASQLGAFQGILGKLGPDIAKNDLALSKMGRNVNIMSKTMKGDMAGATDALTNALIQFKVNLDDPMEAANEMDRMMNVMAASARAGSVEVPEISKALSEVGGVAKMSNLTFEETNAMIQGMAKGGVEVAKIGVAAKNALVKMAAPATLSDDAATYLRAYGVDIKKVSDTTIPFIDRLKEINKVGHDMNALALIFGGDNIQGAQALLSTIGYQKDLTTQVTGTKDAYKMAQENMESWNERMKRYTAVIDDFKTGIFDAIAPVTAVTEAGTEMLATGADLANIYSGIGPIMGNFGKWLKNLAIGQKLLSVWTAISTFVQNAFNKTMNWGPIKSFVTWLKNTALAQKLVSAWTSIATAAQWAWNAALTANPIGLIVVGIAALIALVVLAVKYWDDWGATLMIFMGPVGRIIAAFKSIYDHWDSIKKAFKDEGILGGLKRIGVVLLDVLLKPLQQISGWIDKIFGTDLEAGVKKLRTDMDLLNSDEKAKEKQNAKAPLTEKQKVDNALKNGSLVMYNGKAVLQSSKIKYEKERLANEAKNRPKTLSPESVLGGDKEKKKKKGKGKGDKDDDTTSVSGNGAGVRTINVRVDMKNYFNVDKSYGSVDSVASRVVGKINDRLRDAIVAID